MPKSFFVFSMVCKVKIVTLCVAIFVSSPSLGWCRGIVSQLSFRQSRFNWLACRGQVWHVFFGTLLYWLSCFWRKKNNRTLWYWCVVVVEVCAQTYKLRSGFSLEGNWGVLVSLKWSSFSLCGLWGEVIFLCI